jgi:hypothetical protein
MSHTDAGSILRAEKLLREIEGHSIIANDPWNNQQQKFVAKAQQQRLEKKLRGFDKPTQTAARINFNKA